jgi:hypothetical protein
MLLRRAGARALAIMTLVSVGWIIPGATSVGAAPTVTPKGPIDILTEPVTVTTSTGRELHLYLQVQKQSVDIHLLRADPRRGSEDHNWNFSLPADHPGLHFDRDKGTGRIHTTVEQTHHFAELDIRLKQTDGWKSIGCSSGSRSRATIAAYGTVAFRTRTAGHRPWGRIGSPDHPAGYAAKGRAEAFGDCERQARVPACADGTSWHNRIFDAEQAPTPDGPRLLLFGFRLRDHVHGFGSVTRLDNAVVRLPPPTLRVDHDRSATLHVTTRDDSIASGTAVLSSPGPDDTVTQDCRPRPDTEVVHHWSGHYHNGTHPLRIRMDVGQVMRVHDRALAQFTHTVAS